MVRTIIINFTFDSYSLNENVKVSDDEVWQIIQDHFLIFTSFINSVIINSRACLF